MQVALDAGSVLEGTRKANQRIEHAAAGGLREADRHLKAVILEDVGDRQTPEQRIPEVDTSQGAHCHCSRTNKGGCHEWSRTDIFKPVFNHDLWN